MIRPTLYVLVGLPASGKTHWVNATRKRFVSPDSFRYVNGEYKFDKERESLVWDKAHAATLRALQQGLSLAFDATNLTVRNRAMVLRQAKKANARAVAVVMGTPFEVCQRRNAQRAENRRMPEEDLQRMRAMYEAPSYDEGFERIIKVPYISDV